MQLNSQKQQNQNSNSNNNVNHPIVINRIIYLITLILLLMFLSFQLKLFQQNDLISLIIGFIVCILIQFKILSYCWKQQMQKLQIDQIGIIKYRIKSIFGELNNKQIQNKNQQKYYHNQYNKNDNLFQNENQQVFYSVITHLRSQQLNINYFQIIQKIIKKWEILHRKLTITQKFLNSLYKVYQNRLIIYRNFENAIKQLNDNCYKNWQILFQQYSQQQQQQQYSHNSESYASIRTYNFKQDDIQSNYKMKSNHNNNSTNNTTNYNYNNNNTLITNQYLNWKYISLLIQENMKNMNNRVQEIYQKVLNEFILFAEQIKSRKQQKIKLLLQLYKQFQLSKQEQIKVSQTINRIELQMYKLTKILQQNHIKSGQNTQAIFQNELSLRMLKVEFETLEVKISYVKSERMKISAELYQFCLEQNKWLQRQGLKVFNKKLMNYFNIITENQQKIYTKTRKYLSKGGIIMNKSIRLKEQFKINPNLKMQQYLKLELEWKNRSKQYKKYLLLLLELYRSLYQNSQQTQNIIMKAQNQLYHTSQTTTRRQHQHQQHHNQQQYQHQQHIQVNYNYHNRCFDHQLIRMLEILNKHEFNLIEKSKIIFEKQYNELQKYELNEWFKIDIQIKQQIKNYDKLIQNNLNRFYKNKLNPQSIYYLVGLSFIEIEQKLKLYTMVKQLYQNKIKNYLEEIIYANLEQQDQIKIKIKIQGERFQRMVSEDQKYVQEDIKGQKYAEYYDYTIKSELELSQNEDRRRKLRSKRSIDEDIYETNEQQKYQRYKNNENKKGTKQKSLKFINRYFSVIFEEWAKSQFFHDIIKEQLEISFNRKRIGLLENIKIDYMKIQEQEQHLIENIQIQQSQIYRCLLDLYLNFKGKIVIQISTKLLIGNKFPIQIKLLIKQFKCPIRICFTPYTIGKSYISILQRPSLNIQYCVNVGLWKATKIPLISPILRIIILIKMRKKMLWPKRMTISIPLAFKNTIEIAVRERNKFQREKQKFKID